MSKTASLLGAALIGWLTLHFSGKSILYGRTTTESREVNFVGVKSIIVTCHYFNSTGAEDKAKLFELRIGQDNYFCPRIKDISQ